MVVLNHYGCNALLATAPSGAVSNFALVHLNVITVSRKEKKSITVSKDKGQRWSASLIEEASMKLF